MNILILGGGGREHALAWAIAQNPKCDQIFVAPGNAGLSELATCLSFDINDGEAAIAAARAHDIDFVIIGPEAPLVAGVADSLREAGFLTFGPGKAAAQLEASKAFTKAVCDACGAPTAAYARFDVREEALAYIREVGAPIVVKADGLAAGKGVTVAMDEAAALAAVEDVFDGAFGKPELVIEEFLTGEEASFFILSDGQTAIPIGTAQDHKRAYDGDKGPNTGGMGAYSPAAVMSSEITDRAMSEIITPCLEEMRRRGTPFEGVLFAGLMIEDGAPKLVEFNTRFGDPEAQVLMLRLGAQVLDLMLAAAEHRLAGTQAQWADDHALTVVMAAEGYPGSVRKGDQIHGLEAAAACEGATVFHAGTMAGDQGVETSGGRVLAVTARGDSLRQAQERAYAAREKIHWNGAMWRTDIGWRALK